MLFYLFLAALIISTVGLYKIFEKAGEAGWKAFVPVLNLLTWFKIVGRPAWNLVWFFIPIVNIFTLAYLLIETANSFGRYSFGDHFLAVAAPFYFLPKLGFSDSEKIKTKGYTEEMAYHNGLKEAMRKKDQFGINKLRQQYPQFQKGVIRDWAETAIFAIFAAALIRMFLIEAYTIPTPSMEGSLLVGDYMFVSKVNYGVRMPNTLLQLPLVHNMIPFSQNESYLRAGEMPYRRLGNCTINRYDPVVFNYPEGDTVAYALNTPQLQSVLTNSGLSGLMDNLFSPMPFTHYYGLMRRFGMPRQFLQDNFKLVTRPVDKRDNFIKRCVGLPGDKIEVKDNILYVNDQVAQLPEKSQLHYYVKTKVPMNTDQLVALGVNESEIQQGSKNDFNLFLNKTQVAEFQKIGVDSIAVIPSGLDGTNIFPHDTMYTKKWTMANYGPVIIPKKGQSVKLTREVIPFFRRLITTYEGNSLKEENGKVYINGKEVDSYTPKMDYFFMMGDNRHNSEDSRVWGFVPEDHVVGKPLFIWFSKGEQGIRWNRIFTQANRMTN